MLNARASFFSLFSPVCFQSVPMVEGVLCWLLALFPWSGLGILAAAPSLIWLPTANPCSCLLWLWLLLCYCNCAGSTHETARFDKTLIAASHPIPSNPLHQPINPPSLSRSIVYREESNIIHFSCFWAGHSLLPLFTSSSPPVNLTFS